FFFFQAEDGIRDFHVTGVKTCALPICDKRVDWLLARAQAEELRGTDARRFTLLPERVHAGWGYLDEASLTAKTESTAMRVIQERSEERRVGKWCRSGWRAYE